MSTPSAACYLTERDASYTSNISDAAWELLASLLAQPQGQGRRRTHADRWVYDAILYGLKGGIQWRMLPDSFPPWQTVYGHFRRWADTVVWAKLTDLATHFIPVRGSWSRPGQSPRSPRAADGASGPSS